MRLRILIAHLFISLFRAILFIIPTSVIKALARLLFSKSWERFQLATSHPLDFQRQRLLSIIRHNQDTVFGKKYDFASIRSIKDFQEKVPICNYEDLEPYIERMKNGEHHVLMADEIRYFARTSGTTGPAKYIPVCERSLEDSRTAWRSWSRQVAQVFPKLVRGTILTMHSPRIEGKTNSGIPYGSITMASGRIEVDSTGRLKVLEPLQKIPMSIFYIEDINTKYYVLLRVAVVTKISLMAAINPSTLILMCQKLTEFAPQIIDDCERGSLRSDLDIDPTLRSLLQKRLKPNQKVAERIRRSLQAHGRVRPIDIWPKLCGLLCWKGGSASFYLRQFPSWFGELRVMDYGFAATEGNFSVVLSEKGSQGVAAVTGHFLEFIPEENRHEPSPPVLTVDQLEVGKRYYILITGSHGLYRYDMNDVIEVVGVYHKTPEIVFCHKGGNMISYTGEKIAESQVVTAMSQALEELEIELNGFCVTIRLDSEHPNYVFAVEPSKDLSTDQLQQLLSSCDKHLQQANIEYASKRNSLRLGMPTLVQVKNGAFEFWRNEKLKLGAFEAHIKLPHLCPDPSVLEHLGVVRTVEAKIP